MNSIEDLKFLMEFNPWDQKQDSNKENPKYNVLNSPTLGIASRYDLSPNLEIRRNNGAIDTKITNLEMSKQQKCLAISGPTHQNQTPFQWSNDQNNDPHAGLPDIYNFDWLDYELIIFCCFFKKNTILLLFFFNKKGSK